LASIHASFGACIDPATKTNRAHAERTVRARFVAGANASCVLRSTSLLCATFEDATPTAAQGLTPIAPWLLYCGPKDTGRVPRLVRIALLARRAQRPAGTSTLTEGATPRSILMHSTHPPGVIA